MQQTKKLRYLLALLATFLVSACQNNTSNILYFTTPEIPVLINPQQISLSLNLQILDQRTQPEVSSYATDDNIIKLFSSPTVSEIFAQIIKQDLTAKGIKLESSADAKTQLSLKIQDFYAIAESSSFRHKISANIQLEVEVQNEKRKFTKRFAAQRTQEGALGVKNEDFQKVLTQLLQNLSQKLYQDKDIIAILTEMAEEE